MNVLALFRWSTGFAVPSSTCDKVDEQQIVCRLAFDLHWSDCKVGWSEKFDNKPFKPRKPLGMNQSGEQEVNQGSHSMIEYDAVMKRLGGDRELFKDFVEIFLEDSPQHLQNFKAGLADKNPTLIRHSVHALRGLASNFGAADFCQTAQTIETSAVSGELDQCHDQQQELTELFEKLTVELKNQR